MCTSLLYNLSQNIQGTKASIHDEILVGSVVIGCGSLICASRFLCPSGSPPYNCSVSISYFKLTISLFCFFLETIVSCFVFFKAAGLFFFCICITGYEVHMTQRPTIDLLISKWGWQWLRMWIVYQSESQWSDFHWERIWTMSCFDALIRMCACVRDVGLRRLGKEKHLYGCVCVRLDEWELWVLSWRRKVLFKYQSIYCLKTFQQANKKMTLLQSYKILWTCSWGTLTSPVLFPADFSAGNQRKTCWASTSCDTWCGWSWSWSVRSSSEITSMGTLGRAHLCRSWSVSCRSCLRTESRS